MSKSRPDLSNSKEHIAELVLKTLATQRQVNAIRLSGSRSPLSKKPARDDSDWDLSVVVDEKLLHIFKLPDYRKTSHRLHVDVAVRTTSTIDRNSVEIWPTDEYGVLQ